MLKEHYRRRLNRIDYNEQYPPEMLLTDSLGETQKIPVTSAGLEAFINAVCHKSHLSIPYESLERFIIHCLNQWVDSRIDICADREAWRGCCKEEVIKDFMGSLSTMLPNKM